MSNTPVKMSESSLAKPHTISDEMSNLSKRTKTRRSGLISEYVYFLKTYKMWWLVPVMALFLILGFLVVLGGTKAALLIYVLF